MLRRLANRGIAAAADQLVELATERGDMNNLQGCLSVQADTPKIATQAVRVAVADPVTRDPATSPCRGYR